jgi:hypothetical protein
MRYFIITCLIVFLSGCTSAGGFGRAGSPIWLATASSQDKMNFYRERCFSYGFKYPSAEFSNCLMKVEESTLESSRKKMDSLKSLNPPLPQPTTTRSNCRLVNGEARCTSRTF